MDDGMRYTTVGHRGMAICNPLGSDQLDEVIELLVPTLTAEGRAIDVGCGKGELLIRLAERCGCAGLGIDPNPEFVAEARAAAQKRVPGRLRFVEGRAEGHVPTPASYDVAAVVGATHAYGGTRDTLAALVRMTRPGGHVLLGDGFWRRPPDDAYLQELGATRDELSPLHDLVRAVESAGLEPLHVAVTRDEDWDRYTWAHLRNLETDARDHPEDAQAARLWARGKAGRNAHLHAGRDVMGFALIAARRV
jgi:SAM-dependent methyltransferase